MTRAEAIELLWGGFRRDNHEYCTSYELAAEMEEGREALKVLGVTEEELKECHD